LPARVQISAMSFCQLTLEIYNATALIELNIYM
jgi:hypothetical protein